MVWGLRPIKRSKHSLKLPKRTELNKYGAIGMSCAMNTRVDSAVIELFNQMQARNDKYTGIN